MCPGLCVGQQDPSPRATGQSQGAESRTGGSLVLEEGRRVLNMQLGTARCGGFEHPVMGQITFTFSSIPTSIVNSGQHFKLSILVCRMEKLDLTHWLGED